MFNKEWLCGSGSENWGNSLIKSSKTSQVRRDDQSLLPTLAHSFVACGRTRVPHAPANCIIQESAKKYVLLETELDTHSDIGFQ